MILSPEELFELLEVIWSTQLGFKLDAKELNESSAEPPQVSLMTGIVQISGGYAGAVHLVCGRSVVLGAAAQMFSLPENNLTEEDLRDALGELTNMVGGNLKTLLPGSEFISLPTVIDGSDYGVARLDSEIVAEAKASYKGQPLRAILFADHRSS